jgi:hypothetical protein
MKKLIMMISLLVAASAISQTKKSFSEKADFENIRGGESCNVAR